MGIISVGGESCYFTLSYVDLYLPDGTPAFHDCYCMLDEGGGVIFLPCGSKNGDVVGKKKVKDVFRKVFSEIINIEEKK